MWLTGLPRASAGTRGWIKSFFWNIQKSRKFFSFYFFFFFFSPSPPTTLSSVTIALFLLKEE